MAKCVCFDPFFSIYFAGFSYVIKKNLAFVDCCDKFFIKLVLKKMLLSSPKARSITWFKTRLIKYSLTHRFVVQISKLIGSTSFGFAQNTIHGLQNTCNGTRNGIVLDKCHKNGRDTESAHVSSRVMYLVPARTIHTSA